MKSRHSKSTLPKRTSPTSPYGTARTNPSPPSPTRPPEATLHYFPELTVDPEPRHVTGEWQRCAVPETGTSVYQGCFPNIASDRQQPQRVHRMVNTCWHGGRRRCENARGQECRRCGGAAGVTDSWLTHTHTHRGERRHLPSVDEHVTDRRE